MHPFSAASGMTSTPDGNFFLSGEGGAIALIDQNPTPPLTLQDAMEQPLWRHGVGSMGILPVELLLDPLADLENATDPENLLYIAGGRDGVWVMRVNVAGNTMAFRVDDANGGLVQGNRKYCNSLELITLDDGSGPVDYLVAVFARKDRSHVSVYDLNAVRSVASFPTETGNEISPILSERVLVHPAAGPAHKHSFCFGMTARGSDLYLAMGFHGIVKVTLTRNGANVTAAQSWGPIFGDGSQYAADTTGAVNSPYIYENYHYHDASGADLYDHAPMFLDVAALPETSDHEWLYAAVDHLGWSAFKIDAATPWNHFITGPSFHQEGVVQNSPFAEFRLALGPALASGDPFLVRTYVQRLALRELPDGSGGDDICLIAGSTGDPFLAAISHLNEGRALRFNLNIGVIPNETFLPEEARGVGNHTTTYRTNGIAGWADLTDNSSTYNKAGPCIVLPQQQSAGSLTFFAGSTAHKDRVSTADYDQSQSDQLIRVEYSTWPIGGNPAINTPGVATRDRFWRPGRFMYDVGVSKINPDVLFTAGNDGGTVPGGPLTLDLHSTPVAFHEDFWQQPDPAVFPTPQDNILANTQFGMGIIANLDSGWLAGTGPGLREYRMGARRHPNFSNGIRWRMIETDGGSNVFGPGTVVKPDELDEVFFQAPQDKFTVVINPTNPTTNEEPGRHYYSTSYVSDEYNTYLQQHPIYGNNVLYQDGIVFKSQFGSPLGIWALSARKLKDLIISSSTVGQHLNLAVGVNEDAVLGGMVTHPEFWNVPDVRFSGVGAGYSNFVHEQGLAGQVATFESTMLQVNDPQGGPEDRWILAVACGRPVLDDRSPVILNNSNWSPDAPFRVLSGYDRMMLRLFDVTDPRDIRSPELQPGMSTAIAANNDSADIRAVTILGPDDESHANFIDSVSFEEILLPPDSGTAKRDFVVVTDVEGRVYVYEVSDIFAAQPTLHAGDLAQQHFGPVLSPTPFAKVNLLPTFTDELRSNAYGLAVDEVVSQPIAAAQDTVVAYIYTASFRTGVEIYEFKPFHASSKLRRVGLIQTPGGSGGVSVHRYPGAPLVPGGPPQPGAHNPYGVVLLVADDRAGVRAYTYRDQ